LARYTDLFEMTRRTGFLFEYVVNRDAPEKSVFVMCPDAMWYDIEEKPEGDAHS
jgi:hypothetical protein